jgi:cytochrome c peroxidase
MVPAVAFRDSRRSNVVSIGTSWQFAVIEACMEHHSFRDDPRRFRPAGRHRRSRRLAGLLTLAVAAASSACTRTNASEIIVIEDRPADASAPWKSSAALAGDGISPRILRRFAKLEKDTTPRSTAQIDLGRMLYYEPRLSRTGLVSCNSCHLLDQYGTTNTVASIGVDGQRSSRNAPSTYHASGQFVQFWDGRAATIEDQVKGPLENPLEMGMTPAEAVAVLAGVDGYRVAFRAAFPEAAAPITLDHIAFAIGAFERGLITPARWDRILRATRPH